VTDPKSITQSRFVNTGRLFVPDQETSKQPLDGHELLTKVFDPQGSSLFFNLFSDGGCLSKS
jgi:hypothetical protein